MLSSGAEIHLLDAVGTMCCHDVDLSVEGVSLLQNMIHLLISQIVELCSHVEKIYRNKITTNSTTTSTTTTTTTTDSINSNSNSSNRNSSSLRTLIESTVIEIDDVLVILAHKINSLCSIARGHHALRRSHVSNIFQQACTVINQTMSIPLCCAHAEVRNKCLSFYHRMVMMLKENIIDLSSHLWSVFGYVLAYTNSQDIEQIIGLVHQIAHDITCIDICGSNVHTNSNSNNMNNDMNNNSNLIFTNPTIDTTTAAAHKNRITLSSHIVHLALYPVLCRISYLFVSVDECQPIQVTQVERGNLEKLYLMMIQNCISDGCAVTLVNSPCHEALELINNISYDTTSTNSSLSPSSSYHSHSQDSPAYNANPNRVGATNQMNEFILEYTQGGLNHVLSIAQAAASGQLLLTKNRGAEVVGDETLSISIRRQGCNIISSLINTAVLHAGQCHSINTPIFPLNQHFTSIRVLALEHILPILLQCCSSLPQPRSGASQALYADIGSLVWNLCKTPNPNYLPSSSNNPNPNLSNVNDQQQQCINNSAVVITTATTQEVLVYLRDQVLPSFGWSSNLIVSITGLVVDIGMRVEGAPVPGQIAASTGAGEAQLRDKFKTLFCSLHGGK